MAARFLLLLLTCFCLWSCSSGDARTGGGPPGNTVVQTVGDFVLREDLQILPGDGSVVVEVLEDDRVVLTGQVPPLTEGGALMMNTGAQQFIRRIVSVQQQDGRVIVVTTPGSLLDVFESANIKQTEVLGAEALRGLEPALDGVTFGEPVQSRIDGGFFLPINFENAPIQDRNGNVVARINGQAQAKFGFEQELVFNASKFLNPPETIERLVLAPFVELSGNLEVEALVAGDFEREFKVAEFPTPIPLAGFGPVSVTANVELLAYASGQLNVSGVTSVNANLFAQFGVQADNGQFSLFQQRDFAVGVRPPEVEGTADFSVSLARPKISLQVLGLGEAYVKADALRGSIRTEFTNTPQPGYRSSAEGEFTIQAGATIKVGPYGTPPFSTPEFVVFDQSLDVFSTSFQVGDPSFIPRQSSGGPLAMLIVPLFTELRPGEYGFILNLGLLFPALLLPQDGDWASGDDSVLHLEGAQGFFTRVQARRPGRVPVTCTRQGVTGSLEIQVANIALDSLRVEPAGADLSNRDSFQARAIGRYADGTEVDVTDFADWASSNASVAQISPRGLVEARIEKRQGRGGLGEPLANGQVTLTASFNGTSASSQLGIETPRILQFAIFRGPYPTVDINLPRSVFPGDFAQLEAGGMLSDNSFRLITRDVAWSSDDPNVARISASGALEVLQAGTTVIRARLGETQRSFRLNVSQGVVGSLTVTPASLQSEAGQRTPLSVVANFRDGSSRDVTAEFLGRSTIEGVASFDAATREVVARSAGSAQIQLSYGGATFFVPVSILPGASTHLYVNNRGNNTLSANAIAGDGSLSQVAGSPYPLPGRPSGLVHAGNFVVVSSSTLTTNELTLFQVDPATGQLTQLGAPLALTTANPAFNPLQMVLVEPDILVLLQGFDNLLKLFTLDGSTGALAQHDQQPTGGNAANTVVARPATGGNPAVVIASNPASNDFSVFQVDVDTNSLVPVPGSPFANPEPAPEILADELVVGDFLFAANNQGNNLTRFAIAPAGALTGGTTLPLTVTGPVALRTLVAGGKTYLYVAASGAANPTPNPIIGFEVDGATGDLTPLAGSPVPAGATPRSMRSARLSDGSAVLYVSTTGGVAGFRVDPATGGLTALPGSPYTTGVSDPNRMTD